MRPTHLLPALLLVAAVLVPLARAGDATAPRGPRAAHKAKLLKMFDQDGDGVLSPAERAAARARLQSRRAAALARIDTDGNGSIDANERAAWRSSHGRGAFARGPRLLRRAILRQKVLARFDANGDGVLDAQERAQLEDAVKARRAKRHANQQGGTRPGVSAGRRKV